MHNRENIDDFPAPNDNHSESCLDIDQNRECESTVSGAISDAFLLCSSYSPSHSAHAEIDSRRYHTPTQTRDCYKSQRVEAGRLFEYLHPLLNSADDDIQHPDYQRCHECYIGIDISGYTLELARWILEQFIYFEGYECVFDTPVDVDVLETMIEPNSGKYKGRVPKSECNSPLHFFHRACLFQPGSNHRDLSTATPAVVIAWDNTLGNRRLSIQVNTTGPTSASNLRAQPFFIHVGSSSQIESTSEVDFDSNRLILEAALPENQHIPYMKFLMKLAELSLLFHLDPFVAVLVSRPPRWSDSNQLQVPHRLPSLFPGGVMIPSLNGMGDDVTDHAEYRAIRYGVDSPVLAEHLQPGAVLYSSVLPCDPCLHQAVISNGSIEEIVFGVKNPCYSTRAFLKHPLTLENHPRMSNPTQEIRLVGPIMHDQVIRFFENAWGVENVTMFTQGGVT